MPATVKEEAREVLDTLPDDATWDQVVYAMEFRMKVLKGLADARAGRVHTMAEVSERLGFDFE
jgi:hypothetical protein